MNILEIKDLMQQFDQSSLTKLKLKQKDFEVVFSKQGKLQFVDDSILGQEQLTTQDQIEENFEPKYSEIKTPMVGTFYTSNEPGGKPFVKVGDQIEQGQIIGIIEAMKTMNEIPSPISGKVISIAAKDGELLGFDSLLMTVEE